MPPERRRALVVGIDNYPAAPLAGCVKDANAVADTLTVHSDGSPNFATKLITAPGRTISRASLRKAIGELFRSADDCDVALFYFSGHGTENDLGGYLVTPDATQYDEGVPLAEVLALANDSQARERIVILDSCHSGHLGLVPASGSTAVQLQEGVSVLTAARSSESALEVGGSGVFTELLVGALDGGASDVLGETTVAAVYAYIEQALGPWSQRPMFRTSVAKLVSLKRNRAAVSVDILRLIPGWFPTGDHQFQLDPSFEPDASPANADHEAIFEKLQRCRAAKLVEPVGEEHMYYAAMNSKTCQLTPLGRHYWRLAQGGLL
jgi:caspase domain-containing protein